MELTFTGSGGYLWTQITPLFRDNWGQKRKRRPVSTKTELTGGASDF